MKRISILIALVAIVAAACGGDDDSDGTAGTSTGGDARTVEIDMVDIAFEPESIDVDRGETVRFVFTNDGEETHDAFVGDEDAQADHEMEMREGDDEGHGGGHDDDDEADDAITVEPGETGELTYTFEDSGTLVIGCHQPGHYDAGMKITVDVS